METKAKTASQSKKLAVCPVEHIVEWGEITPPEQALENLKAPEIVVALLSPASPTAGA